MRLSTSIMKEREILPAFFYPSNAKITFPTFSSALCYFPHNSGARISSDRVYKLLPRKDRPLGS